MEGYIVQIDKIVITRESQVELLVGQLQIYMQKKILCVADGAEISVFSSGDEIPPYLKLETQRTEPATGIVEYYYRSDDDSLYCFFRYDVDMWLRKDRRERLVLNQILQPEQDNEEYRDMVSEEEESDSSEASDAVNHDDLEVTGHEIEIFNEDEEEEDVEEEVEDEDEDIAGRRILEVDTNETMELTVLE